MTGRTRDAPQAACGAQPKASTERARMRAQRALGWRGRRGYRSTEKAGNSGETAWWQEHHWLPETAARRAPHAPQGHWLERPRRDPQAKRSAPPGADASAAVARRGETRQRRGSIHDRAARAAGDAQACIAVNILLPTNHPHQQQHLVIDSPQIPCSHRTSDPRQPRTPREPTPP